MHFSKCFAFQENSLNGEKMAWEVLGSNLSLFGTQISWKSIIFKTVHVLHHNLKKVALYEKYCKERNSYMQEVGFMMYIICDLFNKFPPNVHMYTHLSPSSSPFLCLLICVGRHACQKYRIFFKISIIIFWFFMLVSGFKIMIISRAV